MKTNKLVQTKINAAWWVAAVFLMTFPRAIYAANDTDQLAQGAVVGASTEVVSNAVLNTVAPEQPNESASQRTLRRAMTGAVTGAAAAKLSGTPANPSDLSPDPKIATDAAEADAAREAHGYNSDKDQRHGHNKHKHKHPGDDHDGGFRPPGWDRGKKTGWGGHDQPPGLVKNKK